ncbi:hypothetical protein F5Y08DRAFT_320458 [Xylaria arbuscula]|nr:hypothetical protein F5Y08DRAFT_320458 [Xylaria arbuscula]
MSCTPSFRRFSELPTEIRLLIWEQHFKSFFKSPLVHTLNGGFLSWDTNHMEHLSSLRSITSRGRLLKSLADRFDWHMRDVPILQWKTVIHDISPVWGRIYSAHHHGAVASWPGLRPLINHEALEVARACCQRYEVVDLWLDSSTLNISQPCLVDVAADIFRVDPGIAKMMLGLDGTNAPWLARIRRLAVGPFGLRGQYDVSLIFGILELTRDVEEVYVLLEQEVAESRNWRHGACIRSGSAGVSLMEMAVGEAFESKLREMESSPSEPGYAPGHHSSDGVETLQSIVHELSKRCNNAKIAYGYLEV